MTDAPGPTSVRRARYDLALALLAESPPRRDDAVAHLKLATDEAGNEPPTWELLAKAAATLADIDPNEALGQYLRCFRYAAPDELADEVRTWVERQRPGTLRVRGSTLERLTGTEVSPARRLLAARVHFALGDPQKAYDTLDAVDGSDPRVGVPQQELEARCLIELQRFEEAHRVIEDDRAHDLGERRVLLRARLAYVQDRFEDALEQLRAYQGEQTDDLEAMKILVLVGAGKAAEVRWDPPGPDDRTGTETWLGRAVAALEARRYDDVDEPTAQNATAREAAEWAERDQPGSLSVQLLKAQARLEAGRPEDFAAGLPILKAVADRALARGRDPYWLERQRRIRRTFDRFGYVYCEYRHLCGRTDLELLKTVDRDRTTYRQDGRLDEIEAAVHPHGSAERAAALDRAANNYTIANAADPTLDAAQQAFDELPTFPRAVAAGWAVYNWTFGSERADGGVPADAVELLGAAVDAVETWLSAEHEQFGEAVWLLAAARMRRVELLTAGAIAEGHVASAWAFANAVLKADDATAQVIAEWVVRRTFDLSAASQELAEYAATLDDSSAAVTEARLIARLNEVGVDDEVLRLLDLLEDQQSALPEDGFAAERTQWRNAVRLHLALLAGDVDLMREALDRDVGTAGWVLERKAFAALRVLGPSALPVLDAAARALPADRTAELDVRAWLAALTGEYHRARALVAEARAQGNVAANNLDSEGVVFDFLAEGTRPLAELVSAGLAHAASPSEVLWWERVLLPWLLSVTDPAAHAPEGEVRAVVDARLAALAADRPDWTDELGRTLPVLGALAVLWRATARRELRGLLAALRPLPALECAPPLRTVIDHVAQETRRRIPEYLLTVVVAELSEGREPDPALVADVRAELPSAVADLAARLAGQPGQAWTEEDDDAAVRAFTVAVDRRGTDVAALWRVLRAVDAMPRDAGVDPAALGALLTDRIPRYLLDAVVDDLAAGREPDRALLADVRAGRPSPLLDLVAPLVGLPTAGPRAEHEAAMAAFAEAVARSCADTDAVWRVHDAVATVPPGGFPDPAALTAVLLDRLAELSGLGTRAETQPRSHVSFVLGDGFVPEDTGQDWVLFSTYIPGLKARIEEETGYVMPGFNVRGDADHRGVLHLRLYETVFESHVLPVEGRVALLAQPPPDGTGYADPLGKGWAVQVPPDAPIPADAVEVWEPLEFAVRYVERFVRDHLADVATVWDVVDLAHAAGQAAQEAVTEPTVLRRWLVELRHDLAAGGHGPARARAKAIDERVRRAPAVGSAGPR